MAGNDSLHRNIDEILQQWRQGDCALGVGPRFLFRTHVEEPLTESGRAAASKGSDAAEEEVDGFIVATQTCDIVRPRSEATDNPWENLAQEWLDLLPENSRFVADIQVVTLEEMTAAEYVGSDLLDLAHLSVRPS